MNKLEEARRLIDEYIRENEHTILDPIIVISFLD